MWREILIDIKKAFKDESGYYSGSIKKMLNNEKGFYSLGMAQAAAESALSEKFRQLRDQYRCDNCSGKGERIVDESRDAEGRTVRYAPCRLCFGYGVKVKPCPKCKGKTIVTVKKYTETGAIIKKECLSCKGKKKISCYTCHEGQLICNTCKGVGELETREVLEKSEVESCDACRATGFAPVFYGTI